MDYHEMEHFIEDKYKCNLSDYSAHKNGIKSTTEFNCAHEEKWKLDNFPRFAEFRKNPVPNYGLNQEGMDFYKTPEGIKWFDSIRDAYRNAPDGKCKELPFLCFWHFMIDAFPIQNGVVCHINWQELKDSNIEDWQKEICGFFVAEFGSEDMEVEFSW